MSDEHTNNTDVVSSTTVVEAVKSIGDLQAENAELSRLVQRLTEQLSVARDLAETRQAIIVSQSSDWRQLNEFLNDYANDESMCSSYENTIEDWNNSFTTLKLTGREQEYTVNVSVRVTYSVDVPVTATTADNASEIVDDMNFDDIMEHADAGCPDDYSWEVMDVTV